MLSALNTTCKSCAGNGNRDTDTVKVDLNKLAANRGKENHAPSPGAAEQEATRKKKEQEAAEERRRYDEQQERRRKEAEEVKRRAEEERTRREAELERTRREEEAARIQAWEAEQAAIAEKMRQEEEQKRKEEERKAAERERQRQAELERQAAAKRAEEAKRQQEEEQQKQFLRELLTQMAFKSVNEKRVKKGLISTSWTYPLHVAVEAGNLEAVHYLLWGGADPAKVNSKKLTPLQIAEKKNKKGSHKEIIALLAKY